MNSLNQKVLEIFKTCAEDRLDRLRGDIPARESNDLIMQALEERFGTDKASEIGFHLVDWNSDAAFLLALILFPEKFTKEEIEEGIDAFLVHVPAHVRAAAELGGYSSENIFKDEK
jgi:hypothetical protein